MAIVSTDDQSRRLVYVYLGPVGFRLPFDVRFNSMGLWAGITVFLVLLAFVLSPPGTRINLAGAACAPFVAGLISRKAMPHVNYDRPLAYWWGVITIELNTPRPLPTTPTTRAITVRDDLILQGAHRARTTSFLATQKALYSRARSAVGARIR